MSHLSPYKCELKVEDLPFLKPMFEALASKYGMNLVQNKTVVTTYYRETQGLLPYNASAFFLLGLEGDVPPVGLTQGPDNTLNLTVDWEASCGGTRTKVTEIFDALTQQLKQYRERKALNKATSVAQKHGAKVNVVIHQ